VIEDFKRTHRTRKQGRRPDEDLDVKRRLDRIVEAIGKRPIAKVRRAHLIEILTPFEDRPTEYRNMRALLRLLWNHSMRSELAPVSMGNVPSTTPTVREPRRDRVRLSAAEMMRVIAAAQRYPNGDAALCVQTLALTGARPKEAMRLRWDDVDLERGTVLWRDRKAGDSMRLPLPGPLANVFRDIRAARPDDVYVFRGRWNRGHVTNLTKPWTWIRKAAKVPANTRLYDLRGSVASMIANAAGTVIAQSVLGHSDHATTVTYYTAADDEQRKRGVDLVSAAIAGEIQRAQPSSFEASVREAAARGDANALALVAAYDKR
jgi:integrase